MMHIVWEFVVQEEKLTAFISAYGADGDWAQLFRKAQGFHGIELLRSNEISNRFITIDRWVDIASFDRFQRDFGDKYKAMDAHLEGLTEMETKIGVFEEV